MRLVFERNGAYSRPFRCRQDAFVLVVVRVVVLEVLGRQSTRFENGNEDDDEDDDDTDAYSKCHSCLSAS